MSWILAFIGFALLVILHELGHFFAAKAVGMRVERFSLFFPPKLFGITRGETEYMVGAVPLGGYVKITGMNPEEELSPELKARSYSGSPVWKRVVVIAAGPVVNLVVAFLILTAIVLSEGKPVPAIEVGEVQAGSPAAAVLKPGDRITGITYERDGRPVSLPGDTGGKLTLEQRDTRVSAMIAGIATGSCDAATVGTTKETGPQVEACERPGSVTVAYVRDGQAATGAITPRYDDETKRYRLGLGFEGRRNEPVGVLGASGHSLGTMWDVTERTISAIGKLFYDAEARKEVSGVVGSYETTRQSIAIDPVLTLQIIALISLSLAVINLFPFLPLDGGHILWALVEKLRGGRPVSTATLERASMVGIFLVAILFVIGFTNDVGRITSGEGFGLR